MKRVFKSVTRTLLVTLMSAILLIPSANAAPSQKARPSGGAMVADALIGRPFLFAATVLGTGLYVVSLPFSLAGGNAMQAGKVLVVEPAKNTFVRCLGCREAGYQK